MRRMGEMESTGQQQARDVKKSRSTTGDNRQPDTTTIAVWNPNINMEPSATTPLSYSEADWKSPENMDKLIHKDKTPLIEAKSNMNLLTRLHHQNEISVITYHREMEEQYSSLSAFVESNIENDEQASEVIQLFIHSPQSSFDNTIHCCSFSCCIKYLYLSAIVSTIFVVIAIIIDQFLPLFRNLPPSVSTALFFTLAVVVLVAAQFIRSTSHVHTFQILSIIGASLLSAAYHYSLHRDGNPLPIYFLPDAISWSILAILFQSKPIGFVAIGFLLFLTHLQSLEIWCLTSTLLVSFHIIYILKLKEWLNDHSNRIPRYYDMLEPGILYLGTLCLVTSLLLLSSTSKIPFSWTEWSCFNLLSIAMVVMFFYLGSKVSILYMLRGVACIFATIFITCKWYDINMGSAYYFQQLVGCLLLIIMLLQLKSRPYLFSPHSDRTRSPGVQPVELSNIREEAETPVLVTDEIQEQQSKINTII